MKPVKSLAALTVLALSAAALADAPPAVEEAQKEDARRKSDPVKMPEPVEIAPEDVASHSSYGFGYRNGRQFAQQTSRFGLTLADVDKEAFMRGFFDAMSGAEASLDEAEVNAALRLLQENIQKREDALGAENLAAGKKFLEENGKREGVITTESGLQYEILTQGDGPVYEKPEGTGPDRTQFMIQYKGTLIDGTEFDSSKGNAVPMGINTVPGFREALTSMPTGSTWKIYLNPELGYGAQRRSSEIGPNTTLVFELTLEEIKTPPPAPAGATPGNRPTAVSPPIRVPIPENVEEKAPAKKEAE